MRQYVDINTIIAAINDKHLFCHNRGQLISAADFSLSLTLSPIGLLGFRVKKILKKLKRF